MTSFTVMPITQPKLDVARVSRSSQTKLRACFAGFAGLVERRVARRCKGGCEFELK
jgi:hypothetical protein